MPTAQVDGVRLHYLEVGTGEPAVVLLHAFPLHAEQWGPQLACLSSNHRVIAPDLKGFGRSDAPPDRHAYTMESYASEVATLLEQLGVTRAVVGGLSMGGYVTFEFLRRYRDMAVGVVLADTRALADSREVLERRSSQQAQVERGETSALIDALLEGLLSSSTKHSRPELVAYVRSLMAATPPAGIIGALEAMKRRPDSTADLSSIDVPTLVLVGEEDALSPPDVVTDFQSQIGGSRLAVLPRAGHLSNLEAPDDFNAAVVDFLAEV